MLYRLSIKNIALVDTVDIDLSRGFTVITGETGAGKSLILSAFAFLLGEKADASQIRNGAFQASVEAVFEIKNPAVLHLLSEAGIASDDSEYIVKRELLSNGKTRAFINNQQVLISLLKKITSKLILSSNQHAHLMLLEEHAPLFMLDTYGDLTALGALYRKSYEEEQHLQHEVTEITQLLATKKQKLEQLYEIQQEIAAVALQEGEEQELEDTLFRLSHSDELSQKCEEFIHSIEANSGSVLENLIRHKRTLERIIQLDEKLQHLSLSFDSLCTELKEILYEVKQYAAHIEFHPEHYQRVQDRLHLITKIKKKYGPSIQDVFTFIQQVNLSIQELENSDYTLEEKQKQLLHAQSHTKQLAKQLSYERKQKAGELSTLITHELQNLNMPHAAFEIHIENSERSYRGCDTCTFYMTPNLGEKRMPVHASASGGELARLSLAFHKILRQKLEIPTILFDEIDANIGGHTATYVGKALKQLGDSVQVISITHFPQVAEFADQHLCISKNQQNGRTITNLFPIATEEEKQKELLRMQGKF